MREHVLHSLSGEKVYKCFVQDCSFSFAITLAKMNNSIKLDLWSCKWFMSSRNLAVSRTPLMVALKHIAHTASNSFLRSIFFFFFANIEVSSILNSISISEFLIIIRPEKCSRNWFVSPEHQFRWQHIISFVQRKLVSQKLIKKLWFYF